MGEEVKFDTKSSLSMDRSTKVRIIWNDLFVLMIRNLIFIESGCIWNQYLLRKILKFSYLWKQGNTTPWSETGDES